MDGHNQIVGIIGRKGSGKSTMMERLLKRCPRLFLFDTMGEHSWVPNRFHDFDDADRFLAWAEAQEKFGGSFIPEGNLEADFRDLADFVYDCGDLIFGVEEIPMLCSPSFLPQEFDRIVRLGRHREVSVVWTAQRAAEVARRLTAATDVFIIFSQTEPRDLDAIQDRCGREVAQEVADLPLHGHLTWNVITRKLEEDEEFLLVQE